MSFKQVVMMSIAIFLFALGSIGLFPFHSAMLLAGAAHMYTVGLSADPVGWHMLGILGGSATVAGLWVLASAFRKST